MTKNNLKQQAAERALDYIAPGEVIAIGSGSTVNIFIDLLAAVKGKVEAAVAASKESEQRLRSIGIEVVDLIMSAILQFILMVLMSLLRTKT